MLKYFTDHVRGSTGAVPHTTVGRNS